MFRIIVFIVLLGGLVYGLLPRPLLTPDWRTGFEQALSDNNCDKLERLLGLVIITDHQSASFEIVDTLEQREICDFKHNSEKSYDRNKEFFIISQLLNNAPRPVL